MNDNYANDIKYTIDKSITTKLLHWYAHHARELPWRQDINPYHIWLSEIMLQQTRALTVIPYYERFLKRLPTIEDLANVNEDELMKLWEGLGYYRRARNLQKTAKMIVTDFDGMFPKTYDAIRKLPGIGPYTAGAISSICFNLPYPAIDGNVLRVFARFLEITESVDQVKTKQKVDNALVGVYKALLAEDSFFCKDDVAHGKSNTNQSDTNQSDQPHLCGTLTQAIMELGATVCIPNGVPMCNQCPLQDCCRAFFHDTVMQLPVRNDKKAKRDEELTVLILFREGNIAIHRRPDKGLLAGMWELPNLEGHVTERGVKIWADEHNLSPIAIATGPSHTHVFTHIRWHMQSCFVECGNLADGADSADTGSVDTDSTDSDVNIGVDRTDTSSAGDNTDDNTDTDADFIWVTPQELTETYALPTAFRKFISR
ncbi:MAG: A/G-specific adenine glycosylase [Clostridiales Family XIII bacterium]|nr:A/G-specific adenine glycosylase [Clostridiales Family XIII bacterium]